MAFKDNYQLISGWIHDYYCDKDGAELIFDINNNKYFECPICHFKYTDEKKKRAWITKYRYKTFKYLEDASNNYLKNKNEKVLKKIINILNYYSLNYEKFAIHNKNGETFNTITDGANKCGKITAQGLNEAMICINVAKCLSNINLYIDSKTKENVFNLLFKEAFILLKPQVNKIHNICCYEICAIAIMGITSNNQEMLKFAFYSPYSFYKQLNLGLTKDYFWYEGSFHYHFFILKPILELLEIAKFYNFSIPKKYYNIAKMMLIEGFKCSFRDCTLPSPNDGWPNKNLLDYIEVYNLGTILFKNDISKIKESIINKTNSTKSKHFIDSGFSLLKNKYWNVFIKYQDTNINHAHPDKLNLEIKCGPDFLTHDLSTSGYGANISKDFYKKTYSHNTIVIDGQNQNLECKSTINYHTNSMIDIFSNNIYNGVNINRKIKLMSNKIIDEIKINNYKERTIDYFFHCDATLITKLKYNCPSSFKEYPYLKNIKEVNLVKDIIILKWQLKEKTIISKINCKNKRLFIGFSPNNPDINNRTTLIIRCNSNSSVSFNIKWQIT